MNKSNVSVICKNINKKIDPRTVHRRLLKILSHLQLFDSKVSCILCDDTFIRELNRTYRNLNKPTDVLSFSMKEGEPLVGDEQLLGDIVISVETAIRQGTALGRSPLDEVTSLLVHGLLHLLGYDHQTPRDEKIMYAEARGLENLFVKGGCRRNQQSPR